MSKLIFVVGSAGVGKSTVAKDLARRLNYTYLDKDTMSDIFTDSLLETLGEDVDSRESQIYSDFIKPIEYQQLLDVTLENLNLGNSVIISAPLTSAIKDKKWLATNIYDKIKDVAVKVVYIKADSELIRERVKSRNCKRDNNKLLNWENYYNSIRDNNINWDSDIILSFYNNYDVSSTKYKNQLKMVLNWIDK